MIKNALELEKSEKPVPFRGTSWPTLFQKREHSRRWFNAILEHERKICINLQIQVSRKINEICFENSLELKF